jgi:tetratricopeptide (TPR) repeat protein
MGVLMQKNHQSEAARSWYDKALASQPTYSPALVNRANLSLQTFEYAAAEEDLKLAVAQDPLNADAYVALGIAQKKQGNLTGAKSALNKAVDLDPDNAYARFNLGVLMADDLKRPNEALRLFHEVLQTSTKADDLKELARSYINDLKKVGVER